MHKKITRLIRGGKCGKPVTPGFFVWLSSWESSGPLWRVEGYFSTSVTGPKGSAGVSVAVHRAPTISSFTVTVDTGEEVKVIYDGEYPCKD